MKFKNIRIIILAISLLATAWVAKGSDIKGLVIDAETGEPLIGATVMIEETKQGMTTDIDGKFHFKEVKAGSYTVVAQYVTYDPERITNVVMKKGEEVYLEIKMKPSDELLSEVEVVAKANQESENALLMKQRQALLSTQAVGAMELSRKGLSDAEAAVAQVSGVSKQDGVKNVFVRGLGDRYNATLLNGFPVPSEDPEYKNIALDFFGTDLIQNIAVQKVFSGDRSGDVGGAIIDISSKQLYGDHELKFGGSIGCNSKVDDKPFLRQDGSDYMGFSQTAHPTENGYKYVNSLDPTVVKLPMDADFSLSMGKQWKVGENRDPLSFLLVASHATAHSFTDAVVRNAVKGSGGEPLRVYQDQSGQKYSIATGQLALANISYELQRKHNINYNLMLVHNNQQYVGDYVGLQAEKHQDSDDYTGFLRRQQTNDNLLIVNQLTSEWRLSDRVLLDAGAAYNVVIGNEPDRRENYLSHESDGHYFLTGSNRQKRFFSTLRNNDINLRVGLTYQLKDRFGSDHSHVKVGYAGRVSGDHFEALEYNYSAAPGFIQLNNLQLAEHYSYDNRDHYTVHIGEPNTYDVDKRIHGAYIDGSYMVAKGLTANLGMRVDKVNLLIDYVTQSSGIGDESIDEFYLLPSLNLRYDLNEKHVLRLGASKTYTLPQSKEIAPYQYVNIGFASQGNPKILPSDNYNIDLKWDFYPSHDELLSLNLFYKRIINPIARVDKGNSAGLLEYDNVSRAADVAGVEVEVRKTLWNTMSGESGQKIGWGVSGSFIHTSHEVLFTDNRRDSRMEGAAPFIINTDLTHTWRTGGLKLVSSLVLNYFSDRIHTIGTNGYNDIVETGVPTLNIISSLALGQNWSIKLKATNLIDPNYTLSRKFDGLDEPFILDQYKKGRKISLGISYQF